MSQRSQQSRLSAQIDLQAEQLIQLRAIQNLALTSRLDTPDTPSTEMNIEFSTEQLELQLNPSNDFIPASLAATQEKPLSEGSTITLDGPMSLQSPSGSQVVPLNDWRFRSYQSSHVSTNIDDPPPMHPDDLCKGLLTPNSTPPRTPQSSDYEHNILNVYSVEVKSDACDLIAELDRDIYEQIDAYDELPEAVSDGIEDYPNVDDLDNILMDGSPSQPEIFPAPDLIQHEMLDVPSPPESVHEASPAPAAASVESSPQLLPSLPQEVPVHEEPVPEPVAGPSGLAKVHNTRAKPTRGRKRKITEDPEKKKREQNANAAKRYRQKRQAEQAKIFEELQKLEEENSHNRSLLKNSMERRNMMLQMFYELTIEKKIREQVIFPDWLDDWYEKVTKSKK